MAPQCHRSGLSLGGSAYCVEFRGDWKWQRESWGLKTHWGAANFCHVCTAKRDGLSKPLGVTLTFVFFGGKGEKQASPSYSEFGGFCF